LIIMRRPHDVGHAFAVYRTKNRGLAYVDFLTPGTGGAYAQLVAAEGRPHSAAQYKNRLGDLLESAVSTRAMVFDVAGRAYVDGLLSFPQSMSLPRVVVDDSPERLVGRGGGEIEGAGEVDPGHNQTDVAYALLTSADRHAALLPGLTRATTDSIGPLTVLAEAFATTPADRADVTMLRAVETLLTDADRSGGLHLPAAAAIINQLSPDEREKAWRGTIAIVADVSSIGPRGLSPLIARDGVPPHLCRRVRFGARACGVELAGVTQLLRGARRPVSGPE
jgi:hypothetical protein